MVWLGNEILDYGLTKSNEGQRLQDAFGIDECSVGP